MVIGLFSSIQGWGGSEIYLLRLMKGITERGHKVVLFGVEGSRLWHEAGDYGCQRIAWNIEQSWQSESLLSESAVDTRFAPKGSQRLCRLSFMRVIWNVVRVLPEPIRNHLRRISPIQQLRRLREDFKNYRAVLRALKKERVDVMHINLHAYEVASLASKRLGIPVFGVWCMMPEQNVDRLRRIKMKISAMCCNRLAAKSVACLDAWCRVLNLRNKRCAVIPNGVPIIPASSSYVLIRPQATSVKPLNCLYVGRLAKGKHLEKLMQAFGRCAAVDWMLTLVGAGEYEAQLRIIIDELGLSERVRFKGHQDDVQKFYQEADCFVFPPSEVEGCPNALLEAMGAGLPAITFDAGPMNEINLHGVTGYTVNNHADFTKSITALAADPALRQRLGSAGRQRVENYYSYDAMIEGTLQQYEALVQN